MEEIRIEKAVPADAAELLRHLKIVGAETDNLTFGSEGFPFSLEDEQRYLESLQGSTHSVMYTAKCGDRIVGTADFKGSARARCRHYGSIGIAVERSMWNRGVGSMLLEAVLRFARETVHAEIVQLEVRCDNAAAIHLYRKFGFQKVGTIPGLLKIDGKLIDFDVMVLRM